MRQKVTSREQIREAALAIAVREGIDHVSIRKLAFGIKWEKTPEKGSRAAFASCAGGGQTCGSDHLEYGVKSGYLH